MERARYQFLNTLGLKIIVIFTMTLDHIGNFLQLYFEKNPGVFMTGSAFRIIGRIAFPLVALLFAEAMKHTHDREHYMSRLGLIAMIILVTEVGVYYGAHVNLLDGNIFLTLLCSASFIYFIESKDKRRFLFIIPLAVIVLSFIADIQNKIGTSFYPSYLKAQFSLYGFILCVGFYYMYNLADERVKSLTGKDDLENLRQYPYYRTFTNLLWIGLLTIVTIFFWLISYINNAADVYDFALQSYAMLAIIPIMFYNGKKGYQNKVFQYGCYLYYPIHILILFLCFYLTMGGLPIGW